MPTSMNKHGRNLSRQSLDCCFRRNFVNLKKLMITFWNTCVMIREKFVEVLFLIRNILKVIRNFDPESLNSITVSIPDVYQIKNEINSDIS